MCKSNTFSNLSCQQALALPCWNNYKLLGTAMLHGVRGMVPPQTRNYILYFLLVNLKHIRNEHAVPYGEASCRVTKRQVNICLSLPHGGRALPTATDMMCVRMTCVHEVCA